jgi:hypothetical protein
VSHRHLAVDLIGVEAVSVPAVVGADVAAREQCEVVRIQHAFGSSVEEEAKVVAHVRRCRRNRSIGGARGEKRVGCLVGLSPPQSVVLRRAVTAHVDTVVARADRGSGVMHA